jgi:very-short-patch-repair endonuclease
MARLANTTERQMFYGATPLIFERANQLRKHQTESEKLLWEILKNKQMLGLRFKRQHPIDKYIADFYCHSLKLVIEVDGKIHFNPEKIEVDRERTAIMENFGIIVTRFTNDAILQNIEIVRTSIEMICSKMIFEQTRPPSPLSPL